MGAPAKCKKCEECTVAEYMLTYGDMVTLLLTFFVLLYNPQTIEESRLQLILAAFSGLGMQSGGNTLQVGKLAELGNTVMALPSLEYGRAMDKSRKKAISLFQPEINTKKVRVTEDERGLIISLAADSFFRRGSAEIDMEKARSTLQKAADLLKSTALAQRTFKIEGHTDSIPTDPDSLFPTNWELSTARATNVLHYLVDFGVDETRFQVAGFADTRPLASNDTEEGRAYNRRVDIVILTEGHL
ncbi:MAG: flagellar motor protein MotB [Spirochaetes bacterium]|nr:MAG: flagellar motor protein MotB [Spirochaetota bacterium]